MKDGGDFLLVDLVFLRSREPDHYLEEARHGRIIPLFDKGGWLRRRPLDEAALATERQKRFDALTGWFPASQSFVRKAILRGRHVEAVAAFGAYTLRPLAELLRMRYCAERWDFGRRYLDRDLPSDVYDKFRVLVWIRNLEDLEVKLAIATQWGDGLLLELGAADRATQPQID